MSESAVEFDADGSVDSGDVVEFLHFRLDGDRYALELGWVSQAVRRPEVTRIPRLESSIYGATTVEGDVVVAVDAYELLGLERPYDDPADGYLVLLDEGETPQPIGLLVEAVNGIERHHIEAVEPPSENGSTLSNRWFRASITAEDGTNVQVFDGHQLVAELLPSS